MPITVNIYYTGEGENARKFAEEMVSSGIVEQIRSKKGNIRYEYFFPMDNPKTVLLIDSWDNQEAIDNHHRSPMMNKIIELREKYDLKMRVERFISDELPNSDKKYVRD